MDSGRPGWTGPTRPHAPFNHGAGGSWPARSRGRGRPPDPIARRPAPSPWTMAIRPRAGAAGAARTARCGASPALVTRLGAGSPSPPAPLTRDPDAGKSGMAERTSQSRSTKEALIASVVARAPRVTRTNETMSNRGGFVAYELDSSPGELFST
jgi:hypothetical protein